MAALLIPIGWLGLIGVLLCRPRSGVREAILKATIALALFMCLATEVLSPLHAIAFTPVAVVWLGGVIAVAVGLTCQLTCQTNRTRIHRKLRIAVASFRPRGIAWVFAATVAIVVALTLIIVSYQYPYDNDSVSYHMPRVANWINQGHVGFYPTANTRELFYAPGSTYIITHVQLLSGTDKYSALPQYAGMLLCLMLVSMLAHQLGLSRSGQWLAAAITCTIPMFASQSHCNQNELVHATMLLGFAYLMFKFARRPSLATAIWIGCAFGMATLVKGTALLYCAAIGGTIGFFAIALAVRHRRAILRTPIQLAAAVVIGIGINLPFLVRCMHEDKTYLDNEFTVELRNERLGLDIVYANALRNAAMHLAWPNEQWNKDVTTWVREAVGDQQGNSESTFRDWSFALLDRRDVFYATNPFHLGLALAAWLLVVLTRPARVSRLIVYVIASVLSALLYCALLKYQYWGIRLQLPWLVFSMPIVAMALARIRLPTAVRSGLQAIVVIGLLVAAMPALLYDYDLPLLESKRPALLTRDVDSRRFGAKVAQAQGKSGYRQVAAFLMPYNLSEVGLITAKGNRSRDYNWWVVFDTHAAPGLPKIRHVSPHTWPAPVGEPPEWVIVRAWRFRPPVIDGHRYKQVFRANGCRAYQRQARRHDATAQTRQR